MTTSQRTVTVSSTIDAVTEIREFGIRIFRDGSKFALELDGQVKVISSRVSAVVSVLADSDFGRRIETAFGTPKPTLGRLLELFPRYQILYTIDDAKARPEAQILQVVPLS